MNYPAAFVAGLFAFVFVTLLMWLAPSIGIDSPRTSIKTTSEEIKKTFLAGIIATGVMTLFMLIAPLIGLPKMNVGAILGEAFKGSRAAGWAAHCVIGIILAFPYVFIFNRWLPVEHKIARGLIYGILVFIFSEIIFTIVNVVGLLQWVDRENMAIMVFGDAIACMIYGAVLGIFVAREGYDSMEDTKRHA